MAGIPTVEAVRAHFDGIAKDYDNWKNKNGYYYRNIKAFVRKNIRPNSRVLEVGCGTGEILETTRPAYGVGVDLSPEMVRIAKAKYPQFKFFCSPIEDFRSQEKFDYIVLVDVLDHVYDIVTVFESLYRLCHPTTKIIITTINPWWDPLMKFLEKMKAKMPEGPHNFIEERNIRKTLELLNFSINYSGFLLLMPLDVPLVSYLANTIGVRTLGLRKFSAVQYMTLHPTMENTVDLGLGCSVIIPCHNEEGNIENAVRRIPQMGKGTEIIVVNDGSTDRTAERVRAMQKDHPNLKLIDYSPNRGKGVAVDQGFRAAKQEVIMILDADLSVMPEELPRFFTPLNKGLCQFVNGSRMVYPMESQAMRTLNLLGNKIFGLLMTFITGQNLTDTLCGTKALYRMDYQHIKMGLDRWGDFDLLFGAAQLGNKIMEVPVHYMERRSGESKMKTFRHGFHLLRACLRGFRELVLVPKT